MNDPEMQQSQQSDSEQDAEAQRSAGERKESGLPGGGVGRRDEPGHTGVYPLSDAEGASEDAPIEAEGEFGQGDRGIEGYYDSGSSEIHPDNPLQE